MNNMTMLCSIGCGVFILLLTGGLIYYRKKLRISYNELHFLKKEKEHYDEAMFIISLKNHEIMFANKAAKSLFSFPSGMIKLQMGKTVQIQLENDIPKEFFRFIEELDIPDENTLSFQNVSLLVSGKKQKATLFIHKTIVDNKETLTCVIDRVKEEVKQVDTSYQEGTIDFLTRLPSQFKALADINHLVIESKKKSEMFGVFLMGVDHFSDMQTSLGLSYTNRIIKRVAQYFIDMPDETMNVYRMDADKFLFLINGLDEDELARTMAKELIVTVGTLFRDNSELRLTSSIGIVLYPRDGENAAKLIDNAYIALDKAQQRSESNIEILSNEDAVMHIDEIQMNEEIKQGLIKSEFLLFYQPIFDIKGEQIIGAEALLRWQHPKHGLISADKFLHVAEKTGLIVDLGEYAFNEAIKQRQHFGVGARNDFQITINMSLKEMQVEELIPRLEMLFMKYNVDTYTINLDISESHAMENIDKTLHDFKLFKALGLSLSLEHFGAGYSSFKYLNLLPIDTIKIDRSLIFDLTLNLQHQTTVKAIIELAHTLGYKVVAEGVETSQESSILKGLHCDYAQGYLYSRPLPAKEFKALLN